MLLWKDGRCSQGYDDILFHLIDTCGFPNMDGFDVVYECIQKGMKLTEGGIYAMLLWLLFEWYGQDCGQVDMLHFCIENFESAREQYPLPISSKDLSATILELLTMDSLSDYLADDIHLLNHQTRKLLKTACLKIYTEEGFRKYFKKFIVAIEELEAIHEKVLQCLYKETVQPHVAKEIITTVLCEYI